MTAKLSVFDAYLECLQIIADVCPDQRYKVIAALHRMEQSTEGARVLASTPLEDPLKSCNCSFEDCINDADVTIGAQAFCRYHATDGLLSSMDKPDRLALVAIHVTSDELAEEESAP